MIVNKTIYRKSLKTCNGIIDKNVTYTESKKKKMGNYTKTKVLKICNGTTKANN